MLCGVWHWLVVLRDSSAEADGRAARRSTDPLRSFLWKTLTKGGITMRVVVIKSPRMLGGLLRKLFGIQKMPTDMT